jgi:hypothetical protein
MRDRIGAGAENSCNPQVWGSPCPVPATPEGTIPLGILISVVPLLLRVATIPLFVSPAFPPLADYPGHLAITCILENYNRVGSLQAAYILDNGIYSNLVFRSIQTIHSSTPEPMLQGKTSSHRRRPVSTAEIGPGLRREIKGGDAALNHLNASEH